MMGVTSVVEIVRCRYGEVRFGDIAAYHVDDFGALGTPSVISGL